MPSIPPEKGNLERITNSSDTELALQLVDLYKAEKEIKAEKEFIENVFKLKYKESCFFANAGLKHTVINKTGNVDWKEVCSSWDISENDLEKFRKPESKYSKFTII